ncbi:MAG: hypothetical protein IPK80_34330 [Nannocystis sp.]|nr:hypothetical protein [Nannocystis sp.]
MTCTVNSPRVDRRDLEFVRALTPPERDLLLAAHASVPASCAPEIHWTNLYVDGAFVAEAPQRDRLHSWVLRLVAEVYADWPEVHLISYGFVVNPAGSSAEQPFHCDYGVTTSNLFIPLTRVTLNNATRFIRQPLARARPRTTDFIGTVDEILEAEGCEVLEVVQLACRPFCLLRLLPGTPHAGVPNREDYDRAMFWVTVDSQPRRIGEGTLALFREDPLTPDERGSP